MATMTHRLYVGTVGEGLWRSTDGGASFARTCEGMFVECHVRALAVHPREPGILYLGSQQKGHEAARRTNFLRDPSCPEWFKRLG